MTYPSSPWQRRRFLQWSSLLVGSGLISACRQAPQAPPKTDKDLEPVTLGLGWKAEAEYGGFYQALAQGIYRDYGLDVTIDATPPQTNITQLLMGGLVTFSLGTAIDSLKSVQQGVPKVSLASIFQDDIQILLAHPDVGVESLADLKGKPIFVSASANNTYWPLLKAKYGFTDDQKRPYNFNISPFLVDKNSAQQGLLTSEPYLIAKQGGFKPVVLRLTEAGYNQYFCTIDTTRDRLEKQPDLVKRFVEASIKGWYQYLENPQLGNQAIKTANPEMTQDLIDYGLTTLKNEKIILGGEAQKLGIGAMGDRRWQEIYERLRDVGIFPKDLDYRQAYTLDFINQGHRYDQTPQPAGSPTP
ncbi:MAG: ABC transporter substrate-binding protein [Microcystaceae cyanobacterium]